MGFETRLQRKTRLDSWETRAGTQVETRSRCITDDSSLPKNDVCDLWKASTPTWSSRAE